MSLTVMNIEESRELEARCANRMGLDELMRRAGEFAAGWIARPTPAAWRTPRARPAFCSA